MPRPRPASRIPLPLLHLVTILVALIALAAGELHAAPYLFPATPDGEPGQVRDERDVAPFLAAWKAAGLQRARLLAAPATANQQAYDVHYYDLDLTPDPATQVLTGTVRMKASVVSGPLSTADLDFYANLTVDAVTSGGVAATFSRSSDLLTVNLDRVYGNGEMMDVVVSYHGAPSAAGSFGFNVANGRNLVWSLSEPFGARSWWPCKDAPEDKADSVDIRVTVPTGMITASNGTRIEATDNGTIAVTRWRERYPIATYLVSLASYPYTVTTDHYRYSPTDSMPIQFFNFPETVAGAATVQARVKDMIATYAGIFGEYPFVAEKYGHAQFLFGGGMEHQTCTSLGGNAYIEYIVAHELAHQWWGDLVTCRDFHHIWVNEGFATYCEALWAEAVSGTAAYHADLSFNKYFGSGTIYVPDLTDENRIFDSNLSYNKGSWVLHMLRRVLGDPVFFAALRQFYAQYGYSTATTEDFRDVCEAVSGRDLDAFFQQWIYGEYYPHYRSSWTSAPAEGGHDVTLSLEQIQPWQLFNMPLDVKITTEAGEQAFVIQDSLAAQTFTLHVDAAPTAVAVDPDDWVLKTLESPVVDPPLDRHVLLVNGVDWASYGTEITSAYTDHAFSGGYTFDFWDNFSTPSGGYPAALPAPLGHGAVPPEVMGRYRVVIWVGNNYNGDLASWQSSPVLSYLRAGGNVLLMSRYGDQFLATTSASALRPARRSTTASPRARAWARSRGSAPRTPASSSTPSARAPIRSCSTRWSRTTHPTAESASSGSQREVAPTARTAGASSSSPDGPIAGTTRISPRTSSTCSSTTSARTSFRSRWTARPPRPRVSNWPRPGRTRSAASRCCVSRSRVRGRSGSRCWIRRDGACGGSSPGRSAPARTT